MTLKSDRTSPSDATNIELMELAESSFKAVLDADYHLDDKASRILSTMAFLTAAAAAVFAKAYTPTSPPMVVRQKVEGALSGIVAVDSESGRATVEAILASVQKPAAQLFGWDASLIFFALYIFCVLVSTAFYLAALGPALNKPAFWSKGGTASIRSRLFYDFIARVKIDDWKSHWNSTPVEQMRSMFTQDYIQETWFLAEKTYAKFYWMSFGSIFFRIALFALTLFIATLFSPNTKLVEILATLGLLALGIVFALERLTRPPRPRANDLRKGWLFWLMTFLLVLLIFIPMILKEAQGKSLALVVATWGILLSAYTFYRRASERNFNDDKWGVFSFVAAHVFFFVGVLLLR